jgi:hypothetical protein
VNPEKVDIMQRTIDNIQANSAARFPEAQKQTRVVIGLGHTLYSANVADQLRILGIDVFLTEGGEAARRLAMRKCAKVVVLPFLGHDPLLMAKIVSAVPKGVRTILVSRTPSDVATRFAILLGVSFAAESCGVNNMVARIL